MDHSSNNLREDTPVEDAAEVSAVRRVPRVLVPSLIKGGGTKRTTTTVLTSAFISELLLPGVELRNVREEDTRGKS